VTKKFHALQNNFLAAENREAPAMKLRLGASPPTKRPA
jgi:hypothetical protein